MVSGFAIKSSSPGPRVWQSQLSSGCSMLLAAVTAAAQAQALGSGNRSSLQAAQCCCWPSPLQLKPRPQGLASRSSLQAAQYCWRPLPLQLKPRPQGLANRSSLRLLWGLLYKLPPNTTMGPALSYYAFCSELPPIITFCLWQSQLSSGAPYPYRCSRCSGCSASVFRSYPAPAFATTRVSALSDNKITFRPPLLVHHVLRCHAL